MSDTTLPAPAAQDGEDVLPTFDGPWIWALGALLALGNFVAVLDLTITNVSVPTISGALGGSLSQGTWIITSYAVAEAVTVPLTGWLAARFGPARTFPAALGAFGLVSLLCALSPTLGSLVVMRVLQGLCGGPLMPLSQTLMLRIFPQRQQPAAMGLWSVTTLVAPVCGPILGGTLCDHFGWQVIFLINVPIAGLAAVFTWRVLSGGRFSPARRPFDYVGLGLLIVWVSLLQILLDLGKDLDWFDSPLIRAMAAGSACVFAAFLIWELTAEAPIVNLRVFRHLGFSAAMAAFALTLGGFFATNVLTPLWLQTNMGYTAAQAGLASGATAMLAVASAPAVAALLNRTDPRRIACFGVSWLATTSIFRGLETLDMTFWQVWGLLLLVGLAMPSFFIPLTMLSMGAVDEAETADAAGLSNFVRTLAGAFATSLATTRWENTTTRIHAELAGRSPRLLEAVSGLSGDGLASPRSLALASRLLDQQAVMIATNRLFWDVAVVLFAGAGLVWLVPRPKRAVDPLAAH